ncbi:double-strand break repair helicase AddA [Marinovum sp. 2_MG-2023]|uniref:double-strand break repair helicase AddA n=1 Tax=unclassified Marinovum TaxID=2647166 RepID=UPI0026E22CF6|nr:MULTISPECIES: double-strand break repair helicase AddA [unclassified Marinovum]MDO6730609.1 double-strand break repair helicase AddA [Marinovum sp. 2_MG-2023]MDO6778759.1 double-strand break repair helicase AddA [Marinovum sp. 1_MG-2023]
MTQRNEATLRQIAAADPERSTWLAANAGSGKTRVLTDRVARLLLQDVSPEHILCLTYTKAAASEMQNRLFQRLGDWAMKDDAALRAALHDLGIEGAIPAEALRNARTLFARAIEAPGGLKIQTIHSFCAAILRRFPLEAGVSPQFKEMEDRSAALLRAEIVDQMADGPDAHLVANLASHLTDMDFDDITAEVSRNRVALAEPLDETSIKELFGLSPDMDEAGLLSRVFLGGEMELLSEAAVLLSGSGKNDQKAAAKLNSITAPNLAALSVLENVLLNGASAKAGPYSAKIDSFPTKGLRQGAMAPLMDRLEDLMRRVEDGRNIRCALAATQKTRALQAFAGVFLPRYAAAKLARGWLDFDDLIHKTLALMTDRKVAQWVLYRLDGGIDHILVDEAQDTSPVQWRVIEELAREFTSGEGARADVARTIFVVGDKKQSIYSFQGADPAEFDRMKADFAERLRATDQPLQDTTLQFSFRSSEAILRLVDTLFEAKARSGFSREETHRAFKSDMGGRVDLWPCVDKISEAEKGEWDDPVDLPADTHHDVILARRIAREIKRMLDTKATIPWKQEPHGWAGRTVTAGDFLILVRRRSDLFAEIIRACKEADLPIAGADRLKVGAELAVRDLAALLSWLALPEDDLSLAVVLKSPLVGWDESQLYDLAQGREQKYLWRELAARQGDFAEVWAMLTDLQANADFMRPYDLIERILTRHEGRYKLLARLGNEAEDGINALLSQALAYEATEVPSLTGFLIWMETDDLEIKRQMDSAGDRIRVMTVHGSKGLEAPIVILPDTGKWPLQHRDALLAMDDTMVWKTAAGDSPAAMAEALEEAKEKQRQERDRLLYVAMTRAEVWLMVAAAGDLSKDDPTWYQSVEAAMKSANAERHDFGFGEGLRYESGDWPTLATVRDVPEEARPASLPDWATRPATPPPPLPVTLSPSKLGGAHALAGEAGQDEEAAKRYGTLVHDALERLADLPPEARKSRSEDPEQARAMDEACAVLDAPALAPLFAPGTLAEVAVSADVAGLGRMHGVIDRLIVEESRILAVDFKTNAVVPTRAQDTPEALLRQMGAYAAMLKQLYPNHEIATAILWTASAALMPLPHDLVTAALGRTTSP